MTKPIFEAPIVHPHYKVLVLEKDGEFIVINRHSIVGDVQQGEPYASLDAAIEAAQGIASRFQQLTQRVAERLAAKKLNVSGMGPEELMEACERGEITI